MIRLIAFCLALAGPALAEDRTAATRLAEAQLLRQAANGAENRVAALAGAIRAFEDGLVAAAATHREAQAATSAAQATIDAKSDNLERLMSTLMTLRQAGSGSTALHPNGPTQGLRASMLRSAVRPGLATEIAVIRQDLIALDRAKAVEADAHLTLQQGQEGLAATWTDLTAALDARPAPSKRFVLDQVEEAILAASITSLADLPAVLATTIETGLPNDAVLAAKGSIPQPVTGRVLHGFGSLTGENRPRRGITFATPAKALVVSPSAATILYQGAVSPFENVVVIEPTAGVQVIFAGLAQMFGESGQIIPAGTPLGVMGGETSPADMNLTTFPSIESGGASQALYFEVRERQTPVDPATWFALEQQVDEQ